MTSPLTGAYTSEAALADSTTAAAAPFSGRAPGVGNSTKTRSPSCSCAWSVIPTVATSPSIRSHSWSSVNFNIAIDLRGSISVAFVAMRDERQITDLQRNEIGRASCRERVEYEVVVGCYEKTQTV